MVYCCHGHVMSCHLKCIKKLYVSPEDGREAGTADGCSSRANVFIKNKLSSVKTWGLALQARSILLHWKTGFLTSQKPWKHAKAQHDPLHSTHLWGVIQVERLIEAKVDKAQKSGVELCESSHHPIVHICWVLGRKKRKKMDVNYSGTQHNNQTTHKWLLWKFPVLIRCAKCQHSMFHCHGICTEEAHRFGWKEPFLDSESPL